jgi:organic hydroperoxide reductase OsmC/OhrA
MMKQQHHYNLTITWTGNSGSGTSAYKEYERSHSISAENKANILASSDPAFRGDKTKHNPEELFLASISSCHMLWYLHLCAEAGIVVSEYVDSAEGIMTETPDGGGKFTAVTLNPIVTITDLSKKELAEQLHHNANKLCFIANSLNLPVHHKPLIKSNADIS